MKVKIPTHHVIAIEEDGDRLTGIFYELEL